MYQNTPASAWPRAGNAPTACPLGSVQVVLKATVWLGHLA